MQFLIFIKENGRWLLGGFLLTLFSSFGQTFFIALGSGGIRAEFALSHGEFGALYMGATLASAASLPFVGRIVDHLSVSKTVLIVVPTLAAAALSMALATHLAVLALTLYLLRLFGQGMMTHIALTAMGRWFSLQRGRAMSVVTIGHQVGEASLPVAFVALAAVAGWRGTWFIAALLLAVLALPSIWSLMRTERSARPGDGAGGRADARQWSRAEVLRDPLFYLALVGILAPGFIGTTIFFHQVYLVELRGWSMEAFAASFAVMSLMTLVFALVSGHLIDRFSAVSLLPTYLVPLALACFVLSGLEAVWSVYVFMALLGVSYGISSTLLGALWPEIYGVRHLGAIRSIVVAALVFATALGPGVTGFLIDRGVSYPSQIAGMGAWCLAASALLLVVSRRVHARNRAGHDANGAPSIHPSTSELHDS